MSDASSPLVYFVDDEASARIVFRRTFEGMFRSEAFESAEAALEKLTAPGSELPAVVVTDQRMPGMQGAELLEEIRQRSPDTMRVMLSAFSDPGPLLDAINKAGAARYLVKPWKKDELAAVIREGIDAWVLKRRLRSLEEQLLQSQRLSFVGLMTANVAHDLGGPLSLLRVDAERVQEHALTVGESFTELEQLRGTKLSDVESEAKTDLPTIGKELMEMTEYMAALVTGMRLQARAATTGEPADVLATANFAGALVRHKIASLGGTLELPKTNVPPVVMTSNQLAQVLSNVMGNAVYALRSAKGEKKVAIVAKERDGGVEISVRDTGEGMSPELLEKVRTQRVTTKPASEGTGLGVAICRELVQNAGGTFEMKSALGEGTTVTVWIPAAG